MVASSNQDCELALSVPVLFGEDVDTSCDLKCVTIATIEIITLVISLALLTQSMIVMDWLPW